MGDLVAVSPGATMRCVFYYTNRCVNMCLCLSRQGAVYSARLPQGVAYIGGWVYETLFQGSEIKVFDYHQGMDRYIIGTSKMVSYKLAEDELHPEWNAEGMVRLCFHSRELTILGSH